MFNRCRRNRRGARRTINTITLDDVLPHVKTTLFITGAFCVAWSWDLVVYSISHIRAGEDPLDNQLAFANQPGPKNLLVLLAQYVLACGGAAAISNKLREDPENWTNAAVMAVEFFPSPIFAGKLMSYLSQFNINSVQQALINLAATWFAAFLAHLAPMYLSQGGNLLSSHTRDETQSVYLSSLLKRTGMILRESLGFGLGIAWNVLLSQFGPSDHSELNLMHFLALATYLLMVLAIAFKLAALVKDDAHSVWERHLSLMAFAMYVVCGFTLVGFLNTIMHPGWIGSLESFGILLFLAGVTSSLVASADLDGMMERRNRGNREEDDDRFQPSSWEYKSSKFGQFGGILNCLIFVPCVWCCCPWIPVLILLAGMTETIGVKEHWYKLIAMVAGLASSIEGSGMLTEATDALAQLIGICGSKHCHHPWLFVLLQILLATATTVVIIPAIAPLSDVTSSPPDPIDDVEALPSAPTEDQALLYSAPPPPRNPDFKP